MFASMLFVLEKLNLWKKVKKHHSSAMTIIMAVIAAFLFPLVLFWLKSSINLTAKHLMHTKGCALDMDTDVGMGH